MLKKPWRICTVPEPWQVVQVIGLVPGLAPLPLQVSQVSHDGNADLRLLAVRRFLERDLHRVAEVAAAIDLLAAARRRPRPPPKMSPKMSPKASAKPPKPSGAAAAAEVRVDAGVAVLVVGRALLRVGQHLVGFLGLLELLLGLLVVVALVAVRVVLHRQLAIGLLDLLVGGVLRDAEHLVVVALCHGSAARSHRSSSRETPRRGTGEA